MFAQNVLFRDEVANRSIFVAAGEPSPFRTIEDVPPTLRALIGTPDFSTPPPSTATQYSMSPEHLEAEREAFRQLAGDEDMRPDIEAALDERDRESQRLVEARNQTYAEIEDRRDAAYDRVAKEIAEEADRLIERKQK